VSAGRAVCSIAATVALAGCAPLAVPRPPQPRDSRLAQAQATHEYPSPAPPPESAHGSSPSAIPAIRSFAAAYINWTAQTVSADMQSLAAQSVGQARSALELVAAQTADDYELRRGGIANSGSVEAVAPVFGHRDQYVVVTRERTTATNTTLYQGLRPAWHLALATVVQLAPGERWVLTGWQPES
jgi:hypothetical protein